MIYVSYRYGGTMSLSGVNYNEDAIFASARSAEEYIDTAIAKNIQHSLKMYEYGGHFRSLLDLYEKGELTNVINRVVENINHSLTRRGVNRVINFFIRFTPITKNEKNYVFERDLLHILYIDSIIWTVKWFRKIKKIKLLKVGVNMKTITRTKYLDRIIELNGTPDIKIITGIRRSGKSKLMQAYMEYLKKHFENINIIFIDFMDLAYEEIKEYHALHTYVE